MSSFQTSEWKGFEMAKKRYLPTLLILLAIFLSFPLVLPSLAKGNATETTGSEPHRYYKSVLLEPGDTLTTIADEYMTDGFSDREAFLHEVCRLNHLSDDTIHAGAYLVIPYYEASAK